MSRNEIAFVTEPFLKLFWIDYNVANRAISNTWDNTVFMSLEHVSLFHRKLYFYSHIWKMGLLPEQPLDNKYDHSTGNSKYEEKVDELHLPPEYSTFKVTV